MLLVAHCLQLRKRLLNPFNENLGGGNFDGDSSEIAKEIPILRKELAEDKRNNIVLSGIEVVDRGQVSVVHQPLQGCGAGRWPARPGPGPGHAGHNASAVTCWGL